MVVLKKARFKRKLLRKKNWPVVTIMQLQVNLFLSCAQFLSGLELDKKWIQHTKLFLLPFGKLEKRACEKQISSVYLSAFLGKTALEKNIENNPWALKDMEFIFSCSTYYLSRIQEEKGHMSTSWFIILYVFLISRDLM